MNSWHKKVEARITQTLKFLNTARLLKIIGYHPADHIKGDQINLAMGVGNSILDKKLIFDQSNDETVLVQKIREATLLIKKMNYPPRNNLLPYASNQVVNKQIRNN